MIMWVMIDAINSGYVEFRAMIYGGHPGRYWSGLLKEAHFLAIDHFRKLGRLMNFKLTLIKSPHFCAVIHENNYSQRLHMDSAVAEFLGFYECSYFRETDFPVQYFQTTDFIDYIRSVNRNLGKDTRFMMLPQDGTPLHISMIEYFTRFRDDILQHAKPTCFEDLTVFYLLSFMGKKGYENGIGVMSAEKRTAAGKKGYENGIGVMSAEERMATGKKGYETGIGVMSAEERRKSGAQSRITWTVELDDANLRMI